MSQEDARTMPPEAVENVKTVIEEPEAPMVAHEGQSFGYGPEHGSEGNVVELAEVRRRLAGQGGKSNSTELQAARAIGEALKGNEELLSSTREGQEELKRIAEEWGGVAGYEADHGKMDSKEDLYKAVEEDIEAAHNERKDARRVFGKVLGTLAATVASAGVAVGVGGTALGYGATAAWGIGLPLLAGGVVEVGGTLLLIWGGMKAYDWYKTRSANKQFAKIKTRLG